MSKNIMRGSTPTISLTCSLTMSGMTKARIDFAQYNPMTLSEEVVLSKSLSDLTVSGKKVSVKLTEAETLSFEEGAIKVQLRAELDGDKLVSYEDVGTVYGILKDGGLT